MVIANIFASRQNAHICISQPALLLLRAVRNFGTGYGYFLLLKVEGTAGYPFLAHSGCSR